MNEAVSAAPSRFLSDAKGTYDLASVSAITTNTKNLASLVLDGGGTIPSEIPYAKAVSAWQAYLTEPATTAPAATAETAGEPAK